MHQSGPYEADAAASVPLNAARFSLQSDDVFGRIASRYNLLSDLFSFGIHRHWKRRVARLIASEDWTELLDTASGTGDIVLRVLRHRGASGSRRVVASDTCPQMLNIAGRRLAQMGQHVELRILDAQRMPEVAANSIDLFLRGIEEFPGAEQLAQQIRELGFEEVRFERLSLGIVAIHTARKPR